MTLENVSNPTSNPQGTTSHPFRFGRRAFGWQGRRSQATVVRNIVDSIITHRQLGQNRAVSNYTPDPDTQALVLAKLDELGMAPDEPMLTAINEAMDCGNSKQYAI